MPVKIGMSVISYIVHRLGCAKLKLFFISELYSLVSISAFKGKLYVVTSTTFTSS